jgi:hypothetical protein
MQQHQNKTMFSKTASVTIVTLATATIILLVLLLQQCKSPVQADISKPDIPCTAPADYSNQPATEGITLRTALEMADMYDSTQYNTYKKANNGLPDAQCVWFSLDTLEKFIWSVKSLTCEKSGTRDLQMGLRIYFATYPEDVGVNGAAARQNPDYKNVNPAYGKLHTVFIVPTFQDNDSTNYDFDPTDPNYVSGNMPVPLAKYFLQPSAFEYERKPISTITDIDLNRRVRLLLPNGATAALNHGSLYPPKRRIGEAF